MILKLKIADCINIMKFKIVHLLHLFGFIVVATKKKTTYYIPSLITLHVIKR